MIKNKTDDTPSVEETIICWLCKQDKDASTSEKVIIHKRNKSIKTVLCNGCFKEMVLGSKKKKYHVERIGSFESEEHYKDVYSYLQKKLLKDKRLYEVKKYLEQTENSIVALPIPEVEMKSYKIREMEVKKALDKKKLKLSEIPKEEETEKEEAIIIQVWCPICKKNKRLPFPLNAFENNEKRSSIHIIIPETFVCEHKFQAHVDRNYISRGSSVIDYELTKDMVL